MDEARALVAHPLVLVEGDDDPLAARGVGALAEELRALDVVVLRGRGDALVYVPEERFDLGDSFF
jgi:hypothetical protein